MIKKLENLTNGAETLPDEEILRADSPEAMDSNEVWEELSKMFDNFEGFVGGQVRWAQTVLPYGDINEREDLTQEAREGMFIAYLEIKANSPSFAFYIETIKKYKGLTDEDISEEKTRRNIAAGYLKLQTRWKLSRYVNGEARDEKRRAYLDSSEGVEEDNEGIELFEKVTAQTESAMPEVDEQTRKNFLEYFGARVPEDREAEARRILFEEAFSVMEEAHIESA